MSTETTTTDDSIDLIRDKVTSGEFTLTVTETPFGKVTEVTRDGSDDFTLSPEENDALNALVDQYADVLLELDDVDKQTGGLDRAWHIGRVLVTAEETHETFTRSELIDFLHLDGVSRTQSQRFGFIYQMFPDEDYEDDHTYSFITELVRVYDDPENARESYDRMVNAGVTLTKKEARAWTSLIRDGDEPTRDDVTAAVHEYVDGSDSINERGIDRLCAIYGL